VFLVPVRRLRLPRPPILPLRPRPPRRHGAGARNVPFFRRPTVPQ